MKGTVAMLKKEGYVVGKDNFDVVVCFKDQKDLEKLLKNLPKNGVKFACPPQKGYKLNCVVVDVNKKEARCTNFTTMLQRKALCAKDFSTKDFLSFIAQD